MWPLSNAFFADQTNNHANKQFLPKSELNPYLSNINLVCSKRFYVLCCCFWFIFWPATQHRWFGSELLCFSLLIKNGSISVGVLHTEQWFRNHKCPWPFSGKHLSLMANKGNDSRYWITSFPSDQPWPTFRPPTHRLALKRHLINPILNAN